MPLRARALFDGLLCDLKREPAIALIAGCQLACALLNGRAAAYDRRASCRFRGEARGRPKLPPLTAFGTKSGAQRAPLFWHARAQIAQPAAKRLRPQFAH